MEGSSQGWTYHRSIAGKVPQSCTSAAMHTEGQGCTSRCHCKQEALQHSVCACVWVCVCVCVCEKTDVHGHRYSLIGLPSQSYSFRTRDRVQLNTFANTGSSGQDGDAVVGHGTEIHDTVQGLTNHPCLVSVVL
jgi:hypothetical protein